MAAEEQQNEAQEAAATDQPERDVEPEAPGADADEGIEECVADESDGPEDASGRTDAQEGFSTRSVNRVVVGNLTLHYPARDVTLSLDGDAALRMLTMYWRRRPGPHADRLDPETSSALAGWVVLDLNEPLAISWYPILGSPTRSAIDPVPPQAA